jgi:hypothetical protein
MYIDQSKIKMKKAIKLKWSYHGLPVFDLNGQEWVICDNDSLLNCAIENIKEGLFAFKASFILDFLKKVGNTRLSVESLKKMQSDLGEDANEIILLLLGDHLKEFCNLAIKTDGVGHFLSSYDDVVYNTQSIKELNFGYGPKCFRLN